MVRDVVIRRLLLCEAVGFSAVIAMLWADEVFDLPHVLFRAGATPINWTECVIESIFVGFLGAFVLIASEAILERIRYLQGFLPVCSHCGRICVGDEWMSFEAYMSRHAKEAYSYGLCPGCEARTRALAAAADLSLQAKSERSDTPLPPEG